jgi:cobalt-zinc-cadmium efflux system outer membrane protein
MRSELLLLILIVAGLIGSYEHVGAQLASTHLAAPSSEQRVTLRQFIERVAASNLELAAQRYNVSISKAQLIAARVSPNPTLDLGGGRDVSQKQQPATENIGLGQLIELGGKRHFRVSVATRNLLQTSATVEDFFRTLRGTAANAFVDAVASGMIVDQKGRAFESLSKLAELNRIRLQEGDVAEADYNQALVDSLRAEGDLTAAQATAQSNQTALAQFLGQTASAPPHPVSDLQVTRHSFDLASLLQGARAQRPDIIAARHAYAAALASARLAKANRIPDPTLNASVQQTERGRNAINPSPNFNSVNFGVSFPLPLFNSLRGEALAAAQTALQAQKNVEVVELRADTEVRQGFTRFQLANKRASQFQGQILDLAAKVLDARLTAYKSGGASLLDVLNAQRANTEIRLAAIDALSERAKALVALEQAAGIWEVDF